MWDAGWHPVVNLCLKIERRNGVAPGLIDAGVANLIAS